MSSRRHPAARQDLDLAALHVQHHEANVRVEGDLHLHSQRLADRVGADRIQRERRRQRAGEDRDLGGDRAGLAGFDDEAVEYPETQVVLPVLHRGVSADLVAIATGGWRPSADVLPATGAAVTTVLAARGYPEHPESGAAITLPKDLGPDVLVFHAGTTRDPQGTLRVAGGRVFAVTALAANVKAAARASAAACARIAFDGRTYRGDIAWREIARAGAA